MRIINGFLQVLMFVSLLALNSCSYFYRVPFSAPPIVREKGDIEVGANYSFQEGFDWGVKAAYMPRKNIYCQANFQSGQTVTSRKMSYTYFELSGGYIRETQYMRFGGGFYTGAGKHVLRYEPTDAMHRSLLTQYGVNGFVGLKLEELLLCFNFSVHRYELLNRGRSGNFNGVTEYLDPASNFIFSPVFGIAYMNDYMQAGFYSGRAVSLQKKMYGLDRIFSLFYASFLIK